jgi:hypothetical protein
MGLGYLRDVHSGGSGLDRMDLGIGTQHGFVILTYTETGAVSTVRPPSFIIGVARLVLETAAVALAVGPCAWKGKGKAHLESSFLACRIRFVFGQFLCV